MSISNIDWQDLDLVNEQLRADAPEKLKGVIAFGSPVVLDCMALAKAAGEKPDPELRLLADSHRFTYVRWALTVRPQEDLTVRLVALDFALDGGAVCWSMEPMRIDQELKYKSEATVSSKLKVKLAEVGSSLKEGIEHVVYEPEIEAFNLQRSDPAWELRAVTGKQLSGVKLFHMVVQAPKRAQCHAALSMRADIVRRGFLFSYRARRADQREEIAAVAV